MSKLKTKIDEKRIARLKMIMSKEKITQNELAEKIGITQQNLSRIMCKKQGLTEPLAIRIIDEYPDYSVAWLLGYDGMEWISVNDRLPDSAGVAVIVAAVNRFGQIDVFTAFQGYGDFEWYTMEATKMDNTYNKVSPNWKITHWMPLPEPPEGGNQNGKRRIHKRIQV